MKLPSSVTAAAVSPITVGSLPNVSPAWVEALNAWAQACLERSTIELGARRWQFSWLAADTPIQPALSVSLRSGGRPCEIEFESLAGLDPRLVGQPFGNAPEALRQRVLQAVLADLATTLPAPIAQGLAFEAVSWAPAPAQADAITLPWQLDHLSLGGSCRGQVRLHDAKLLAAWSRLWPASSKPPHVRLPVRVRIVLGVAQLSLTELQGLEPGDWVWIEGARVDRAGVGVQLEVRSHAKARLWPGTLHADQIRLGAPAALRALPCGTSSSFSPKLAMTFDISQIPVPVTFDLGEVALPAHELERLAPQQIVQLPFDSASAPVRLAVAGQAVAEGQLVSIGRRLGVRITRVLAVDDALAGPAGT